MHGLLQCLLDSPDALLAGSTGFSIQERFQGALARRLLYCNRTYASMAGRTREELMQLTDTRLVQHRVHDQKMSLQFQRLIEKKLPYTGVFSWRRPDGRFNMIEYMAVPVVQGQRLFVLGLDRFLIPPSSISLKQPSPRGSYPWKQFFPAQA